MPKIKARHKRMLKKMHWNFDTLHQHAAVTSISTVRKFGTVTTYTVHTELQPLSDYYTGV